MKFDVDFPGLKGKEANEFDLKKFSTRYKFSKLYEEEYIREFCLDKGKVRKAIYNLKFVDVSDVKCRVCSSSGCDDGAIHDKQVCKFISEKLMKEVGLKWPV